MHIYISFQSTCVYMIDFENTDILYIPKFNIHGNYCLSINAQKPYFFPKWNYLSSCHQFLVHNSKTVTQEGHRWARTIECLCRQHKEPFIIGKGFWECYTADLGESFNRNRSRFVNRKRADFQVKFAWYICL